MKLRCEMLCAFESQYRDTQSAVVYGCGAAQNSDVPVTGVLLLCIAGEVVTVLN
jgi:hypothetical protein